MDIAWDWWRTFCAVAETGSLSGAARKLSLTQPTVGRHIDALEAALDQPLFSRSQAGLAPTETALALMPQAAAMNAMAETLLRTASSAADPMGGVVRLTASEIVGVEVLPPILSSFRERHPRIVIELGLSNRNEDLLRRDADIAVRMVRPVQQSIVAKHIGPVGIGLYVHRAYADRAGVPATVADLAHHPLIGGDRDPDRTSGVSIGGRPVSREMFSYRVDDDVAQLAALRAGYGVGVCQVAVAMRDPNLLRVLPDVAFMLDMWLAMHEDLRASPRIRALFDHLAVGLDAYVRSQSKG